MTRRSITPAELKTLRESLGLTVQWVADQANVQKRTVQYWESGNPGRDSVPDDVAEMLTDIDRRLDQGVQRLIDQIQAANHQGQKPADIPLIRYRTDDDLWYFQPDFQPLPATAHAAMLARTRRALAVLGITTLICYMDRENYTAWLGKRKDTDATRSQWACAIL